VKKIQQVLANRT